VENIFCLRIPEKGVPATLEKWKKRKEKDSSNDRGEIKLRKKALGVSGEKKIPPLTSIFLKEKKEGN